MSNSEPGSIDKICLGWSKLNWQDMSDVCVAVFKFKVQETKYVWGGPSSIDKMLLIFPGWECLRPGGQCPDSDSNWLEFKPFLVSFLSLLWNFFSSAIFSFCHCCQIERRIVCLYTSSCFEKPLSHKLHHLFIWWSRPTETCNYIWYLCLSLLLYLF